MAKKRGAETLLFLLFLDYWQGAELHPLHLIKGSSTEFSSSSNYMDKGLAKLFGYPQQKSSRDAKFTLSSSKQEEHLARLFDEILLQVFSKVPYDAPFDETRQTVDKSVTKRTMKESHIAEEKREKESSLFNRDVFRVGLCHVHSFCSSFRGTSLVLLPRWRESSWPQCCCCWC